MPPSRMPNMTDCQVSSHHRVRRGRPDASPVGGPSAVGYGRRAVCHGHRRISLWLSPCMHEDRPSRIPPLARSRSVRNTEYGVLRASNNPGKEWARHPGRDTGIRPLDGGEDPHAEKAVSVSKASDWQDVEVSRTILVLLKLPESMHAGVGSGNRGPSSRHVQTGKICWRRGVFRARNGKWTRTRISTWVWRWRWRWMLALE